MKFFKSFENTLLGRSCTPGPRGCDLLIIIMSIVLLPFTSLVAQNHIETIKKTARFDKAGDQANYLKIYNINGNVTVEGYAGDEIQITAIKKIDARNKDDAERGRKELQLAVEGEGDLILVYVDAPFICLRRKGDEIDYHINRWDDEHDYEFLFDITVKVPMQTNLRASTINRGKVIVENIVANELSASNVNGKVELRNVAGKTRATTVNGNITATYVKSPDQDSKYHTINGTIEVNYPGDLSADIRFQSMHGDLYTDFQNIQRLDARVEKDRRNRSSGVSYRIDKFAPVRIGNGGPEFSFEVLNGDVYIKRIKS